MKVARRLVGGIVVLIVCAIAAIAFFAVEEEIRTHDRDDHDDRVMLAHVVASAASVVFRTEGEAGAARVVAAANWAESTRPYAVAHPPKITLVPWSASMRPLVPVTEGRQIVTIAPIEGTDLGVRVAESIDERERMLRRLWSRWALTAGIVALGAAVVLLALTQFIVARPVSRLAAFARQVGGGDLKTELAWDGDDELSHLGREMNLMATRLDQAQTALVAESERRIAAIQALRHADRLGTVGQLAAGVAHELGTPLNVVQGRAQLIVDDATDEEQRRNATIVIEQVSRMTRIIRQLLDFARQDPSPQESADPVLVAEKTVELLGTMARKNGVALTIVTGDGARGIRVRADEGLLGQVLANLVVNAIHAMRDRGGTIELGVDAKHAEPPADVHAQPGLYAVLSVADEGPGILPQHVDHIFEPFFTTKDVGEGTGLGLSVSYGIVREKGGWIEVESEPGQGARFSVWLPFAAATADEVDASGRASSPASSGRSPASAR